jgi:hypothetical protein
LQHPPGYEHNQKNTNRYSLPDNSVHCPNCPKRWFSESTVIWAVYNYFKLAGYAPELTDQLKREGDIKVTDHLKRVEWIIEAKGLAPAGSNSTDFQTGLGQILMSHYRSDPPIIHALAIPYDGSFPTELVTRIEDKDRACLRLHWIWVKQVPASHGTSYEVKIECPPGSTCECQERIGTFSFWGKSTPSSI